MLLWFAFSGCEGDSGKSGQNLLGSDVQAPIVELILPYARQEVLAEVVAEVKVFDDGDISRVEFVITNSLETNSSTQGITDDGNRYVIESPPWNVTIDCRDLILGPHFIQAMAWDNTGKKGVSPLVMFYKVESETPVDVDTLRYYNPQGTGRNVRIMPDNSASGGNGYGVRFTGLREATIERIYFNLHKREHWEGSELMVEVRSAVNGVPGDLIYSQLINGARVRIIPPDTTGWYRLPFSDDIVVPREFFVLLERHSDAAGDSLGIMVDDGLWRNWHGVIKQNDEWHEFSLGRHRAYNPLMYVVVAYR